jgi:hypothetical protein
MRKCVLLFLLLIGATIGSSQDMVFFRKSRPFAVLTFMRAAARDPHVSSTLSAYIQSGIEPSDSARFFSIIRNFKSIQLGGSYTYPDYPVARQRPKSVEELVNIAAIQSETSEIFLKRIVGLLPNEEWQVLKQCMTDVEPFYNGLMSPHENALTSQLKALQNYSKQTNRIFNTLKRFYGSTWSSEIPFTISLYAIPGRSGSTTASPYTNSLALAVLTQEVDHDMRMGVAIHEICHMLYQEQPLRKQWAIDSVFVKSRSRYARYAYSYFDEALATACGNGWAYKQLHGAADTGEWYADKHINGFAKTIFPMVENYLREGKEIDTSFARKAIEAFAKTFPQAPYEFENLLNTVNIFTDAAVHSEYSEIFADVSRSFRLTSASGSYPISDPQTMQQINSADGTLLFIVHKDHAGNYKILTKLFSQLKDADPSSEGIAMFFDNSNRPVIVVNVANRSRLEKAVLSLQQQLTMSDQFYFLPLR